MLAENCPHFSVWHVLRTSLGHRTGAVREAPMGGTTTNDVIFLVSCAHQSTRLSYPARASPPSCTILTPFAVTAVTPLAGATSLPPFPRHRIPPFVRRQPDILSGVTPRVPTQPPPHRPLLNSVIPRATTPSPLTSPASIPSTVPTSSSPAVSTSGFFAELTPVSTPLPHSIPLSSSHPAPSLGRANKSRHGRPRLHAQPTVENANL